MKCTKCDGEFDPKSELKRRAGGLATECPECSVDDARYTGAMVYSHKTAPELQIQAPTAAGRALSRFLNASSRRQRQQGSVKMAPGESAVHKTADVGQSRRGETSKSQVAETMLTPFAWQPGQLKMDHVPAVAYWYDESSRAIVKVDQKGRVWAAKVEYLSFHEVPASSAQLQPVMASAKDKLLRAVRLVNRLLGKPNDDKI